MARRRRKSSRSRLKLTSQPTTRARKRKPKPAPAPVRYVKRQITPGPIKLIRKIVRRKRAAPQRQQSRGGVRVTTPPQRGAAHRNDSGIARRPRRGKDLMRLHEKPRERGGAATPFRKGDLGLATYLHDSQRSSPPRVRRCKERPEDNRPSRARGSGGASPRRRFIPWC